MKGLATVAAALVAGALAGLPAAADPANPWAQATTPAPGPARAIGGTSAGCVQGAEELAMDGPGFQLVRPSRRRGFGHPRLIQTIRDLGARVHDAGLGVLMIADLGQPRGGPAPTGHKSHQTGLDVDIWYTFPAAAARRPLSRRARETVEPPSLVDARRQRVTRDLTPRVRAVLELAAGDARVARIFVNPMIKQALCAHAGADRAWLRKLRPWWGHDSHFHIRLECPPDSPTCVPQEALPEGDGCAELAWWLDEKTAADRAKGRARYREGIGGLPELPAECAALVAPPG